jgi:hypothetical protein
MDHVREFRQQYPFWAKDPSIGLRTINANAEIFTTVAAFREAFNRFSCRRLVDPSRRLFLLQFPNDCNRAYLPFINISWIGGTNSFRLAENPSPPVEIPSTLFPT